MVPPNTSSLRFTLLARRGMWEFYLGGFLALPARLRATSDCVEIVASGGLRIDAVHTMTAMPPSTPVKPAPTWKPSTKPAVTSRRLTAEVPVA